MASNNNNNNENQHNQGQMPFWDFMQSLYNDHPTGAGIDHTNAVPAFGAGLPFGGPAGQSSPWGHGGGWARGSWDNPWGQFPWDNGRGHGRRRHGRHHHHGEGRESDREGETDERDLDMDDSPDTLREDGPPGSPPAHHGPPGGPHPPPPHGHPSQHGPHHHGRHGSHGPFRRGGRGGRGCPRGRHGPPPPPPPYNGAFDFRPIMHALAGHPFAQGLREYVDQARAAVPGAAAEQTDAQDDTFVPPVDIFNTEDAYVLHISLPGANREDVGVNWDNDRGLLNIAGVVYRPGNEEFIQTLHSSERRVGMFERSIKLPPSESDKKEKIDGFSITAKMENGILIITVPKMTEKEEWTEIHKVDVE